MMYGCFFKPRCNHDDYPHDMTMHTSGGLMIFRKDKHIIFFNNCRRRSFLVAKVTNTA